MTSERKKPPILLSDLGEEEEDDDGLHEERSRGRRRAQPGELSYVDNQRGRGAPRSSREPTYEVVPGRDWKGIFVGIILAVIISAILTVVITPMKSDVTTLRNNQDVLLTQINALSVNVSEAVAGMSGKVDTAITEARSAKSALDGYVRVGSITMPDMSQYVSKADLSQVNLDGYVPIGSYNELLTVVEDLQDQVDAITKPATSDASAAAAGIKSETTWSISPTWLTEPTEHPGLGVDVSPTRLRGDEGYYTLTLTFYNDGTANFTTWAHPLVSLTFLPGDAVLVDESSVWLETRSGRPDWYGLVVTRNKGGFEVVRRMEFESEKFDVPPLDVGESYTFTLELEFEYK